MTGNFFLDWEKRGYIIYPDESEIRRIHDFMISETGGDSGDSMKGNLGFINEVKIYAEKSRFKLSRKAGFLLFHLCAGHCFVDGNKRVALGVTSSFLMINGYTLRTSLQPETKFMIDLAQGKYNQKEVEEIIKNNIQKIPDEINAELFTGLQSIKNSLQKQTPSNIPTYKILSIILDCVPFLKNDEQLRKKTIIRIGKELAKLIK
ncbi:MAG: type II toxin-antitoxin system death-on-curing family toxin [Candidatus Diapherotrites archaeon]